MSGEAFWLPFPGGGGDITIRKNSGADIGSRPRINLVEGSGVSLVVADDATDEEVDVTISASVVGASPLLLHVRDEKASGTNGGSFTSGAWQTRTLNTVKTNEISGASLASNLVTLPAGTYEIEASAPAYNCGRHQTRLYDTTGAAALVVGTSEYAGSGDRPQTRSFVRGRFMLSVESVVRLDHRCQTTSNLIGLGVPGSFASEVYAEALIREVG